MMPETPPGLNASIFTSSSYEPSSSPTATPSMRAKRPGSMKYLAAISKKSKANKAKASAVSAGNAGNAGNAVASSSSLPAAHFASQLEGGPFKRTSYTDFSKVFHDLEKRVTREGRRLGWANTTINAAAIPLAKYPDSAILFW